MKTIQSWFVGAVMVVACALVASKPACADTFKVFDLGIDHGFIVGIDDSGAAVIRSFESPDPHFDFIYEVWVNGVDVSNTLSNSLTPPNLNYDNGASCIPTTSAGVTWRPFAASKCNNGHEVYQGLFGSFPSHGIFTGPNLSDLLKPNLPFPSAEFFTGDLEPGFALNAFGDFVWDDGGGDEFFEAIDLTTSPVPEPGSLILLGTGALTILRAIRRR